MMTQGSLTRHDTGVTDTTTLHVASNRSLCPLLNPL
uniref:Uncharacterized protein n=1 Tax=Rhizophora mucronata TaxID=61149 RepID=A0A2P2PI07_RHIMU